MKGNSDFFKKIRNNTVCSISAFSHLEVINGVTARIFYIWSQLKYKSTLTGTVMRGGCSKYSCFDLKNNIYFGSKNKFIHLFDFRVLRAVKKSNCSILYVHTIWSFFYAIFFKAFFNIPYVFDNHNVEFDRFISTKRYFLAPFVFLAEFILLYFSKYVVVVSHADRQRLEDLYGRSDKIYVISIKITKKPNLNKDFLFKKYYLPKDKNILLFFGSFSYAPNLEALVFLEKCIIPFLPHSFLLLICGKDLPVPSPSLPLNVRYLGFVEDLDELIFISDCVLAPIFSGGGVKTKVVHAMSYNKYIITTKEGVRGVDISHYPRIFVGNKDNFLNHILNLITKRNFSD